MKSKQEKEQIAKALEHDLQFDQAAGKSFFYQVPLLPQDNQKLIHDFYLYLYTQVFDQSGFSIPGLCGEKYHRKKLAEDFYTSNPQLHFSCPVCLHYVTDLSKEGDVEHYFPRESYPFLFLHPGNLYLACKVCNQTYKKNKNVLGGQDQRSVFIPYQESAKAVSEIQIVRKKAADQVSLCAAPNAPACTDKKLQNLKEQYELEERWTKDLPFFYHRLAVRYRPLKLGKKELKNRIHRDFIEQAEMWQLPNQYIEGIYSKWIASCQFDAFYAELTRDD